MLSIVLIGSGNVAVQLAKNLQKANHVKLLQRYSRSVKNTEYFDKTIPVTNNLKKLKEADLFIIAISDDAITSVSKELQVSKGLVVHTSGNKPLNSLICKANKGVFYPVQTFSKEKEISFDQIPICIETEHTDDMDLLKYFANSMSKKVYEINSQQREKLHIAAVFANNFTNHMFAIADDICRKNNVSFDILKPLIQETAKKVKFISPKDAQTGPAVRNNLKVIENQLRQLDHNEKEIYSLITKSIIESYNS